MTAIPATNLRLEDSPCRLDEHGPVFVLGCPRSGTTFLTNCLARLPGIEAFTGVLAPPRLMHLVGWQAAQGLPVDDLLWCVRDVFWQSYWRRRFFRAERLAQWYLRNISFKALVSRPQFAGSVFCYKEPFLCFAAPQFARAFPRARFIHILRDGRDNARSMEKSYPDALSDTVLQSRELSENKNSEIGFSRLVDGFHVPWWVVPEQENAFLHTSRYGRCIWMWKEMTSRAMELRDCVEPARYYEIRYEQFVSRPLEEGQAVCRFLGQPMSATMVRMLRRAFTTSVKSATRTAEPSALAEAETIAGRLLGELGYA